MKLFKKTLIVLLAMLTLLQAFSFCAAAAGGGTAEIMGDVDGDGVVTVVDATLIQKYAADSIGSAHFNVNTADVNLDGFINIDDATKVQRYAADLSGTLYAGMTPQEARAPKNDDDIQTPIIF